MAAIFILTSFPRPTARFLFASSEIEFFYLKKDALNMPKSCKQRNIRKVKQAERNSGLLLVCQFIYYRTNLLFEI